MQLDAHRLVALERHVGIVLAVHAAGKAQPVPRFVRHRDEAAHDQLRSNQDEAPPLQVTEPVDEKEDVARLLLDHRLKDLDELGREIARSPWRYEKAQRRRTNRSIRRSRSG